MNPGDHGGGGGFHPPPAPDEGDRAHAPAATTGSVGTEVADARPVPSPCVRVCLYDPAAGVCQGCHRTLDEITDWPIYTPEEQREVVLRAARRAASARA
jgi:predicted Fe-S protein YdhL (DUF1289 family)